MLEQKIKSKNTIQPNFKISPLQKSLTAILTSLSFYALPASAAPPPTPSSTVQPPQSKQQLELLNQRIEGYITTHTSAWVQELVDFLQIRSISERGKDKVEDERNWQERLNALKFLSTRFQQLNCAADPIYILEKNVAGEQKRNAFLIAECRSSDPKALTVLGYGHADVKPETPLLKPEDKWSCAPTQFPEKGRPLTDYVTDVELTINGKTVKDKQICARGSSDDKGQLMTYLFAVETYKQIIGELPINAKFLFEAAEEIGSPLGNEFVKEQQKRLQADIIIIEDGDSSRYGIPSIAYRLRGILGSTITVTTANNSGHSGSKGYIDNAVEQVMRIASQLENPKTGRITFPEAYEGIRNLTAAEKEFFQTQQKNFNAEEVMSKYQLSRFAGEQKYHPLERTNLRPSLDVHNLTGGSNSTLIANTASVYVTMRLVPDQDPEKIAAGLEKKVKEIAKNSGLKESQVQVTNHGGKIAFSTSVEHPLFKTIATAIQKGYCSSEMDYVSAGGTEPIASALKQYLAVPIVMTGWGDPDSNAHAKNERYLVEYGLVKGVYSNITIIWELGKIKTK